MKIISFLRLGLAVIAFFASTSEKVLPNSSDNPIKASINLKEVQDDKVRVTVTAPQQIDSDVAEYNFAKIIPGTYAIADYGRFIEDFEAFDHSGNKLDVTRKDSNTWIIRNAGQLKSVTYLVNDTYDSEGGNAFTTHGTTIFSPAGTNILADKNFMLNLCGFVGYFSGYKDLKYELTVSHPENLWGSTSLTDFDVSNEIDRFSVARYSELVDSPIMYSIPDTTSFKVGGMEVLLSFYSPNNKNITAQAYKADLERMITAQKEFLGSISNTKKYAVLVYISNGSENDAKGIGALEHNTSTTAVFRENMNKQDLFNVISHEFFHTVTPLNVHSKEIHDFDFNEPKLSAHLWMYEGITEYFAQLFQVNKGLMSEEEFLKVLSSKEVKGKAMFSDSLSFLVMSKNVLNTNYKAQYPNVYMKGALMAMCIDIIIRDNSNGERGILDLMKQLSEVFGPTRPFDDAVIIDKVTELTFPEVGLFIETHIETGIPIDYEKYLKRVGVERATVQLPEDFVFMAGNKPYVFVDSAKKNVRALKPDNNNFFTELGVQENDELLELNGVPFDGGNLMSVIIMGMGLKENDPVSMKVKRNGKTLELKGLVKLNYKQGPGYKFNNMAKEKLKNAWLKG